MAQFPAQEFEIHGEKDCAGDIGRYLYAGDGGGVLHILRRGEPMNIVRDERQQIRPVFTGGKLIPHIWMSC